MEPRGDFVSESWSGRRDLNAGPLEPHSESGPHRSSAHAQTDAVRRDTATVNSGKLSGTKAPATDFCAKCRQPIVARGLCSRCYQQWRGEQPLAVGKKIAVELARALKERGVTSYAAARATGLGPSTIHGILRGKTPRYTTALALAEFLHWDGLALMAMAARMRTCPTCEMEFMSAFEKMATYCSRRCRLVARQRRVRDTNARPGVLAKHRLKEYRTAIEAHCRGCEPFGICRDGTCEIQKAGISPYPLIQLTRRAA